MPVPVTEMGVFKIELTAILLNKVLIFKDLWLFFVFFPSYHLVKQTQILLLLLLNDEYKINQVTQIMVYYSSISEKYILYIL